MTHHWRIRKWLPERFGQPCRIVARGALNTIMVEFADGCRAVTSRYFVRKNTPNPAPRPERKETESNGTL